MQILVLYILNYKSMYFHPNNIEGGNPLQLKWPLCSQKHAWFFEIIKTFGVAQCEAAKFYLQVKNITCCSTFCFAWTQGNILNDYCIDNWEYSQSNCGAIGALFVFELLFELLNSQMLWIASEKARVLGIGPVLRTDTNDLEFGLKSWIS